MFDVKIIMAALSLRPYPNPNPCMALYGRQAQVGGRAYPLKIPGQDPGESVFVGDRARGVQGSYCIQKIKLEPVFSFTSVFCFG